MVGVFNALQHQLCGLLPTRARVGRQGGECGGEQAGFGDIVKAGHCEVAAGHNAAHGQRGHQSECNAVVVANRGTGSAVGVRKHLGRTDCGILAVGRRLHPLHCQTGGRHCARVTGAPLPAGTGCGMPTEKHDMPMALRDEMRAGLERALLVVQRQQIPLGVGDLAIEQQHVALPSQCLGQCLRLTAFGRRQDNAGGRVLHQRAQHRLLALRGFTGATEQGHVPGCAQRLVHASSEFGKERIGQIIDHQRDAG